MKKRVRIIGTVLVTTSLRTVLLEPGLSEVWIIRSPHTVRAVHPGSTAGEQSTRKTVRKDTTAQGDLRVLTST